jgi:ribokinase
MKKKILVVGSLNMDVTIALNRMPLVGETVLGNHISYMPGGKGANQAYAAGKLGGEVYMIGAVGNDAFGKTLLQNMQNGCVNVTKVCTKGQEPTGMAVIYVNNEGDNNIVVIPGANQNCTVELLKCNDALFQLCDYVIFQMEIPYETIFYGIRRAKELGKKVVLNPAPAPEKIPEDIWNKLDYITPNETELMKISGQTDISKESIEKSAEQLIANGVKNVLVTLGSKGVLWINEKKENEYFPAQKVTAVDTTAAGDCFNGAFTVALSEGMKEADAIRFANKASAIAVTRKGAQSSIPGREEIM